MAVGSYKQYDYDRGRLSADYDPDFQSYVDDDALTAKLQGGFNDIQNITDNIAEKYNSTPAYMMLGGYKGLAEMSKYKRANSLDIAKDIADTYGIPKENLPTLNSKIQEYSKDYKVPLYLAGFAIKNSIAPNEMSKDTLLHLDDDLGEKLTSVQYKVEEALEQFSKDPDLMGNLAHDIDHVQGIEKALTNFENSFNSASGNIQQQQDTYNKMRNISDNNPLKAFAKADLNDRARKSIDQYQKSIEITKNRLNEAIKDLTERDFRQAGKEKQKKKDLEEATRLPNSSFFSSAWHLGTGGTSASGYNPKTVDKIKEEINNPDSFKIGKFLNKFFDKAADNFSVPFEESAPKAPVTSKVPHSFTANEAIARTNMHNELKEEYKAKPVNNAMDLLLKQDALVDNMNYANKLTPQTANAFRVKELYDYFYGNEE